MRARETRGGEGEREGKGEGEGKRGRGREREKVYMSVHVNVSACMPMYACMRVRVSEVSSATAPGGRTKDTRGFSGQERLSE